MHMYFIDICMLNWFQIIYLDGINYRNSGYVHVYVTKNERIFSSKPILTWKYGLLFT
jgi:hypothetical protein